MITKRPPVIGLAGGIGAGKSAVANILADLGCLVVNSDDLARQALDDPSIKKQIIAKWGDEILDEHNRIDRKQLAKRVFNDPAQREQLEAIIHPWVEARRRERFARADDNTPALVIDAPLVFEANLDRKCDTVIFVDAPREMRLARLAEHRGWDESELTRREAAQMPLDEKRRRSDHVVTNTGDLGELRDEIRRILKQITDTPRRHEHAPHRD